jgi:hypothetical protein
MGLREETNDGIAGDGSEKDVFSKMGPNFRFWSQKSHFGPIFILKGEMLKSPNEENEGFCPTADPPLSHC